MLAGCMTGEWPSPPEAEARSQTTSLQLKRARPSAHNYTEEEHV